MSCKWVAGYRLRVVDNFTEEMPSDVETIINEHKVAIGQPRTICNQAYAAMCIMEDLFDETNPVY